MWRETKFIWKKKMSLSLTSPSHKMPTLWDFFYKLDEKQNSAHYKSYCKGCLDEELAGIPIPGDNLPISRRREWARTGAGLKCQWLAHRNGKVDCWGERGWTRGEWWWWRERGCHGRLTVRENSMEVEANYTCLAFWGRKAAAVKTPPRRGWCRVTVDGGTSQAWGGRTARWWGGRDTFRSRVRWVVFGLPTRYLEIKYNINFCWIMP